MHRLRASAPALRIVASVAMLGWLGTHVDLSRVDMPAMTLGTLGWLAGALALTAVGVLLTALRWQRVLAALDVPARTPTLLSHYLAGMFVGNFLPSTIGGDVLRVSRLSGGRGETPRAVASVVLERLSGWFILPVMTLFALLANPGLRRAPAQHEGRLALAIAIVSLVALVVLVSAAASPRLGGRLASNEGWRRFTGAIHLGIDRFRAHPLLALEVLAVGLVYQLTVMLAVFFAARCLDVGASWTAILAFFPVVAIIQVLPITVSGLGTREAALVFFLQPFGVASAEAVALGLLVYAINLTVSLAGAPAFAIGGRAPRVAA